MSKRSVECQSLLSGNRASDNDVDRAQIQAIHVMLNLINASCKISDCYLFEICIAQDIQEYLGEEVRLLLYFLFKSSQNFLQICIGWDKHEKNSNKPPQH